MGIRVDWTRRNPQTPAAASNYQLKMLTRQLNSRFVPKNIFKKWETKKDSTANWLHVQLTMWILAMRFDIENTDSGPLRLLGLTKCIFIGFHRPNLAEINCILNHLQWSLPVFVREKTSSDDTQETVDLNSCCIDGYTVYSSHDLWTGSTVVGNKA